ncbi:unnamed protein product, partial [Adineta ricciae]
MTEVTMQDAVQRLVNNDTANTQKITSLERQLDDLVKSFEDYRVQNEETTKNQIQALSDSLMERLHSLQNLTESNQEANNIKLKQLELDRTNDMDRVFEKLDAITRTMNAYPQTMKIKETKSEQQSIGRDVDTRTTIGADNITTPINRRPYGTIPYSTETETQRHTTAAQSLALNGIRHSIIVPPASAAPAFHGKHNESPTQFLIRVEEYAESVHAWDSDTLLKGISQFLRDSALEWHCQLRFSPNRPETWCEFKEAFLAQFNSPVRKARQEQEWHECKQKENETINEFLVRLRALWREQKPKESESDLVKHLFCRMRNDLLNMLGVRRDASLEEVIYEVQQIEDVLYRRAKGERLTKQLKQASYRDDSTGAKRNNAFHPRGATSRQNQDDQYNNYTSGRNFQINTVTPNYYPRNRNTIKTNTNLKPLMGS